jgi:dipeptidyl aminopeptidase/acylaminoacyl peptidase
LDSESLYVLAEDRGSVLPYHLKRPNHLPTPLIFRSSTSSIQPLTHSTFLLSASTLTHPTEEFILDISESTPPPSNITSEAKMPRVRDIKQITSWSRPGLRGKHLSEGEPFWFKGANEDRVMGWIVRPPGFEESDKAKWPLVMLIHGGPQVGDSPPVRTRESGVEPT